MTTTETESVAALLAAQAHHHGEKTFVRVGGVDVTYAQAHDIVRSVAAGLMAHGVSPGDRVVVMADNCPESIWAWLGINAASAIDVPLNTAAQGQFLESQLTSAAASVAIGSPNYLARIAAASSGQAPFLAISIGESVDASTFPATTRHLSFDELVAHGQSESTPEVPLPKASTTATLLYTSGTTGPSKGVMIPQRYYPVWGHRASKYLDVRADDVIYCVQPMFHVDARAYLLTALTSGATSVVGSRFSASNFWDELREHGATVFSYIGTMLWLLHKQPQSDRDRHHSVRIAGGAATPAEIHREFEERFGITLREAYGMTESLFIAHADGSTPLGSVGRVVPELQAQLVDDDDCAVTTGHTGELCIRPLEPFVITTGYWQVPQETVDATRNLWFHTGDLLREDDDGNLFFVGRVKDSIRRRGENVSAWEVEQAAMQHSDVLEAAAIGVPSPLGEEDVALLVRLRDESQLTEPMLHQLLARNLPRFAVPRYVERVSSFPKTASERVDKSAVRATGLSSAAWDAEASS